MVEPDLRAASFLERRPWAAKLGAPSARPLWLLALGAVAGIGLAASSLVRRAEPLPRDAVASVNGVPIRRADYERQLAALGADQRSPLDAAARRRVLERLIDEELLVQRGLELGLARHDRRVRADLTSAVIAGVVRPADGAEPSDKELREFYETHREFFAQPERLSVRQIFVRVRDLGEEAAATQRAAEAARRLREGADFESVRRAFGDPEVPPLPSGPLPPAKLQEYLGPTATRMAMGLAAGEVGEPVRSGLGYHVLQLVGRVAPPEPSFEEMRAEVLAEYRRRKGDEALRAYLDALRARADVVVAEQP